ncbi:TetR/AcrR family transcriptional regulator [Stutzerimonas azotifigens]|uniref:TetR/AcrR family transcriptional regulator n=1 Tax=Stutzerimonas azotifigens TaxID=291995 RepID=UPI0004133525|nr:TetR/AcrR family transcriptional regulator [Stutzerimonas azotifigens]
MARPATARKPRASSQARIDAILEAARTLLAEQGVGGLSMYAVAERAGLPPSSVYHFFPSVPALLEGLIAQVHEAFRDCLAQPLDGPVPARWQELSRKIELRMLAIYERDPAARQLILAQHGLAEVTRADLSHDIELGRAMRVLFESHFVLPPLPEEPDVFSLALELGDRVYARSIQQYGEITARMAEEGMRVFDAYLGLYLPPFLPRTDGITR